MTLFNAIHAHAAVGLPSSCGGCISVSGTGFSWEGCTLVINADCQGCQQADICFFVDPSRPGCSGIVGGQLWDWSTTAASLGLRLDTSGAVGIYGCAGLRIASDSGPLKPGRATVSGTSEGGATSTITIEVRTSSCCGGSKGGVVGGLVPIKPLGTGAGYCYEPPPPSVKPVTFPTPYWTKGHPELRFIGAKKGEVDVDLGSVSIVIPLGAKGFGMSAGSLHIHEPVPRAELATPRCLIFAYSNSLNVVVTNTDGIRQIHAPDAFVNVVFTNATRYFLNFYRTNAITGSNSGLYTFSGLPIATVSVENTNTAGTTTNTLRIIDRHGYVYDYVYRTNGVTNVWELTTGGGECKMVHSETWAGSNKTVRAEILNSAGACGALGIATYTSNAMAGVRLLTNTVGEGAAARSVTYTYTPGGRPQQITDTSGGWSISHYDTNGRVAAVFSAYGTQEPTTNAFLCRQIEYSYDQTLVAGSGDTTLSAFSLPRRTIERIYSNEVRRAYFVGLEFEHRDIVCVHPGALWDNASNLVTVTRFVSETNLFFGRPKSILRPDGTATLYFYATNSAANIITTIATGQPGNAALTNIVDGSTNITVTGNLGQPVSETVIDCASGIVLSSLTFTNYDDFNRPGKIAFLDGTSETSDHGCCGPTTITTRDGSVLSHRQDALKRYTGTTYAGVITTNILDAAGRLLSTVRIGTDASKITLVTNTYDTAGRLLTSTDALGNTTTYSESDNGRTRTTTFPDGGTRIEQHLPDGSLWKVTGTAVHPMRHTNGVETFDGQPRVYRQEIKLDANGNDTSGWTKTYQDFAGRHYKTVHSDGATSQSFYNLVGQQVKQTDPDGVTSLFAYNSHGEQVLSGLDMDRDGIINTNGTDRLSLSSSEVANVGSRDCRVSKTYVWATNNSAISNLISETRASVDGLTSWSISFGITNRTDNVIGTNGNSYVTNTAPDGSYTVSHTSNGLVRTVTRRDAAGEQLGQATFGYDPHGRQLTVTDARNGTTTYAYTNDDQVLSVTTPAPGTGQSAQTTSYAYDSNRRLTRTLLPDGGGVTNNYSLKGETLTNYGARVYPVGYTYDAQGRRKTMITWKNFAARTGAATTTWNYDTNRGFLISKVHDDGRGTTNSYTGAGRPATRQWARGIVTTYHTNAAGQTFATTYSDGTTPAVTNHFDRLGRVTNILDGAGSRFLTYDAAGGLLMETNASGVMSGVALLHAYDWLGRRTNVTATVNGSVMLSHHYAYDAASRLTNAAAGSFNATYSYLANSPLVSQIHHRSNSVTAMTTTKSYDYLNRLLSIANVPATSEAPTTFSYLYNDANQRTRRTDPDGSYWLYEYDQLGQLTSGKHYWSDHTPVAGQQFEYAYDDIGNRTSTKEGGDAAGAGMRSATYGANGLNQYTNRTVPGAADITGIAHASASVTVNALSTYRKNEYFWNELSIGNSSAPVWTNVSIIASLTGTNQTNAGNLLHPKATEAFTFDADGNQTSDSLWTNSWDGENRLIAAESGAGVPSGGKAKQAWTLDGQSRWVHRVIHTWNGSAFEASATNCFLWDGNVLLAILDHTNGIAQSYLRGLDLSGSLQGAGGASGVLAVNIVTNGFQFLACDGNGNVAGLVSATDGVVSGRYAFDPFANTLQIAGTAAHANRTRFSTQFADEVSGELKYLYRGLKPTVGRWLNRDPIGEGGGINIYGFVHNTPISKIDLFGLAEPPADPVHVPVMGRFRMHCCDQVWNNSTHCCDCKGHVVLRAAVGTGVMRANYTPRLDEPVINGHQWVELYQNAPAGGDVISAPNFNLGNTGFWANQAPGYAGKTGEGYSRNEVTLSPCDYDIEAFRNCIQSASQPTPAQMDAWMRSSSPCGSYVSWLISACMRQAIHECSSLKR